MKSSVKGRKGGVEWCDREARSRQCPSLVPEKKKLKAILSVCCTLMVGTQSQYNTLRGTRRFGGNLPITLAAARGHPSSAHQ